MDIQHDVSLARYCTWRIGGVAQTVYLPASMADVQQALVARRQLAGYEIKERFYEIGSHAGLNELDALLRATKHPAS